jgi:hypothetical protein
VYGAAVETRFPLRDRTSPDVDGGSCDGIGGHRGNPDQAVPAGGFTATYPARSLTLYVIPS